VRIIDDEQWNEDREFVVELFDVSNGSAIDAGDCRTIVLIIDDDKPGNLAFKKKGQIRHVVTEENLVITVERVGGADGAISCKYRTRQLKSNPRSAESGRHFTHIEGELHFKHLEASASFTVQIPPAGADDEKPVNNLLFGVQLSDANPRVVKIKRDTCIIELVSDSKAKKQADALQELLDRIDSNDKLTWSQ
jgi:hypothetical protein